MGWLAALAVLTALALIPVGVSLRYDGDRPIIKICVAGIKIPLPQGKKKKKKEKPKKEKEPVPEEKKPKPAPAKKKKKRRPIQDFLPFLRLGLDFLGSLRRKLRVEKLWAKVTLAGDDPCDLACNYGRAWAGVSTLMAHLNRILVIKDQDVNVQCDFTAEKTAVSARLDLTMTVGRILSLVLGYGVRALSVYLKFRKGGATL